MTGGIETGFPDWLVLMLFAIFGGLAINAVRLLERNNLPQDRRSPINKLYIAQFIILPIIGGVFALMYLWDQTPLTALLAVQVGASAPLIIKQFAAAVPT
jgi:hypothetical protein